MFKFSTRFFLAIALCFSLGVIVLAAQAASAASVTLSSISNTDQICSHGQFNFIYAFLPDVNDEQNTDFVGFTAVDGNGVVLWAGIDGAELGSGPVSVPTPNLPLGTFFGGINDITARPVTIRMYETTISFLDIEGWGVQRIFDELTNTGTFLARVDFDPSFEPGFCDDLPMIGEPHNTRLKFEAVCSPDPATVRRWHITNPNPYQMWVGRHLMGTDLFEAVLVPAAVDGVEGEVFFETPTVPGDNRVIIEYNPHRLQQDMKASGGQRC